jgi:hypothetical protein
LRLSTVIAAWLASASAPSEFKGATQVKNVHRRLLKLPGASLCAPALALAQSRLARCADHPGGTGDNAHQLQDGPSGLMH